MFVSVSSVIIDDIVMPDGTTHMACLGGGGTHAAMGMRVWSKSVGLVANIGNDFPSDLMRKMKQAFDVSGLIEIDAKTVRAWQLFEDDGTRREVLRSELHNFDQLKPKIKDFTAVYDKLAGVHLHTEGDEVNEWVQFLHQHGNPFILWEPWQRDCIPENREKLADILPLVDCVSPNLDEARLLMDLDKPEDILKKYIDFGAKRVVIRMGASGSIYADSKGNMIKVPAAKVKQIIDQTGAGNAYCAGFVVGCVISDTIEDALCRAAVSASFPLEHFGAVYPIDEIETWSEKRFKSCKGEVQKAN